MKATTSAAATADELASSVDATLARWRAAFESSSTSPSTKAKSTTSVAATIEEGAVLNSKQSGSEVVVSSNSYCDVLLPRSSRQRLSCSTNNNSNEMSDGSKSNKIIVWKDSPDEYHKRLATFRSETYFAKPLCLSPLVCAAFG
jgi:hypothetical protein